MARDKAVQCAAHLEAAFTVKKYLDEGKDVAMLNIGDVSIYSTWSYLKEILDREGYVSMMIPGVPSFCAVAAKLGLSLTEIDSLLHIAPGSGDLNQILDLPGTKVLMKSGKQLPNVLYELKRRNLLESSSLIKNCGLPGEEVFPDLSRETPPEGTGYFATVIVKER